VSGQLHAQLSISLGKYGVYRQREMDIEGLWHKQGSIKNDENLQLEYPILGCNLGIV
jgi:hypothetical protein